MKRVAMEVIQAHRMRESETRGMAKGDKRYNAEQVNLYTTRKAME